MMIINNTFFAGPSKVPLAHAPRCTSKRMSSCPCGFGNDNYKILSLVCTPKQDLDCPCTKAQTQARFLLPVTIVNQNTKNLLFRVHAQVGFCLPVHPGARLCGFLLARVRCYSSEFCNLIISFSNLCKRY